MPPLNFNVFQSNRQKMESQKLITMSLSMMEQADDRKLFLKKSKGGENLNRTEIAKRNSKKK